MNIGFIGIGSMGTVMVPNLVKAGHRVRVWNRNVAATKALEGVTVLTSPASTNRSAITASGDRFTETPVYPFGISMLRAAFALSTVTKLVLKEIDSKATA